MLSAVTAIAQSGLQASGLAVRGAASNIANHMSAGRMADAEGVQDPAPYQPVRASNTAQTGGGVRGQLVAVNPASSAMFAPGSPLANEEGLVASPNVDIGAELISMKLAQRAYEANLNTFKAADDMMKSALRTTS